MPEEAPSLKEDREFWTRCYTATLTGLLAAREGPELNPQEIVEQCREIADAALAHDRAQRKSPQYQTFFFGRR